MHWNSEGTGKEELDYETVEKFSNRTAARVWEQQQINRFGLRSEGGELLNMRNEIDPELRDDYGIEDPE